MLIELSLIIIVVSLFVKTFFSKGAQGPFKRLEEIPCPGGLPIIGNISDFFRDGKNIWKISRERALKHFPIYRTKILNLNVVYILDPEDIEMILKDGDLTSKGIFYDTLKEWTGNGLIVSEGETWRKQRKILTKSFHFSVLRKYIETFQTEADCLVDELQRMKNTVVAIQDAIGNPLLKIIYDCIVGGKSKISNTEVEKYIAAVHTLTKIVGEKILKPWMIWAYKYKTSLKKIENNALTIIHNFSSKAFENFQKNNDENWRMMNLMMDNPEIFNDKDIRDEIDTFIFAGHDTTSSAISFALIALANFPKYQKEVYQELLQVLEDDDVLSHSILASMTFLERFIKECLRFFTIIPLIGRELRNDITTNSGYRIPVGTTLLIPIYDVHHSPVLYPEPEKFDPDRFLHENSSTRHPYSYIPFSSGPRRCIGQKFAVLEMKMFICKILKKFKLESVEPIESIAFIPNTVLLPKDGLRVKFVERID